MMKKYLSVLIIAVLCAAVIPVYAAADCISSEEITAVIGQLAQEALLSVPFNDPGSEDSMYEDGCAFMYDFATLFADRSVMTSDTVINAATVMDEGIALPRGTAVSMQVSDLLKNLPCDNADMTGSRDAAVLYLDGDTENGFRFGRVQRDGQRINAMEYGEYLPASGLLVTITYMIIDDGVDCARISGLHESADPEAMEDLYESLTATGKETDYSRVRFSFIGSELDPFNENDLVFDGLNYLSADPEGLGEMTESVLLDNEDGTFLRIVDGDGFHAVFTCDAEGGGCVLVSYTFMSSDTEGPRGVRLGDSFGSDFNRFRNGENEFSDVTMTELLYGTDGTAPYGKAFYADGDGMTLRYITATEDGRDVEMYMHYTDTLLTEFYLHTL